MTAKETNEASRAYFKASGWPTKMDGRLKPLAELDKGELIALARKYAIVLQTEFNQITPSKRDGDLMSVYLGGAEHSMDGGKTWTPGLHPLSPRTQ